MTLRSIQLEKAVRARIKTALDADPQLRLQFKRAPKTRWLERTAATVIARLFLSWFLAALVVVVYKSGCPPATQSAAGALWFTVAAVMFRLRILGIFYDVPCLTALVLLPAPRDLVFSWQRSRVLRELWRPFSDALAILIIIAAFNHAGNSAWLAVLPMALLAAVAVWAVSVWLTFVPIPPQTGYLPFVLGFLIVVIAHSETWNAWWMRLFVEHCETISLLSPGGWIARAYLAMLAGDTMVLVTLVGLTCLVAASLAAGLNRWKWSYDPEGVALWYSFSEPPEEWKSVVNAHLESLPLQPGPADVSEAIASREFLKPVWSDNNTGWVERCLLRRLTARERTVLEFACLKPPDWTRQIKWGAVFIALGVGICWFVNQSGDTTISKAVLIIGGIAILIGCVLGLPLSSPFERAFCPVTTYGISIPFMAVFPVTAHELMAIALKAGVIRALVFMPVMVLGGAILASIFGFKSLTGALLGLDCAVLSVLAIPWLQMLAVSAGTNDASRFSPMALTTLVVILSGFVGLIAGAAAAMFAPQPWPVLGFALAAASSFGSAKLYMDMYSQMRFDLARRANEY